MEYKLLVCEQCENIISVDDVDKPLFTCPACGTLNDRKRVFTYEGTLIATSNKMNCEIDDPLNKKNGFALSSLPIDVENAITTLLKYGWNIKFKGSQKK